MNFLPVCKPSNSLCLIESTAAIADCGVHKLYKQPHVALRAHMNTLSVFDW